MSLNNQLRYNKGKAKRLEEKMKQEEEQQREDSNANIGNGEETPNTSNNSQESGNDIHEANQTLKVHADKAG